MLIAIETAVYNFQNFTGALNVVHSPIMMMLASMREHPSGCLKRIDILVLSEEGGSCCCVLVQLLWGSIDIYSQKLSQISKLNKLQIVSRSVLDKP